MNRHGRLTWCWAAVLLLLGVAAAPPRTTIPAGATVKVFDVHPADAAFPSRAAVAGQVCTVAGGGLVPGRGHWYAGPVDCSGTTYTFTRVTFELTGNLLGTGAPTCPEGAYTGEAIPDDSKVTLLSVGTVDAWYADRATLEGISGTARGDLHDGRQDGGCWLSGGFTTADGQELYLHQAAFKLDEKAKPPATVPDGRSCPAGAYKGSRLDDGERVKLLSIHTDDAYYSLRARYIGLSGTVSGDLHNNGDCWFGGGFDADGGDYFYFYKAAVKSLGGGSTATPAGCPSGVVTSGSVADGSRVKIVDIHGDDAYYSTRYSVIGLSGQVVGGLSKMDGCWYAGGFTADNGTYYYFYKAAVVKEGGGGGDTSGGYTGSSVFEGATFRILDVHPDDAYYSYKSTLVGADCYATGTLTAMDTGWFAGPCTCAGVELYFYKVKVKVY